MKFGKIFIVLSLIISLFGCVSSNKTSPLKKYYDIKVVKTGTNEIKYIKGKQVLISKQKGSTVWLYPYMNSINTSEQKTLFFGLVVQNPSAQNEILISIGNVKAQTEKYKMLVLNHSQAADYLIKITGNNLTASDYAGLDPADIYALMATNKGPTYKEQAQQQKILEILNDRYLRYETIAPKKSYEGMFLTSLPSNSDKFGIRVSILEEFHDFYFYFK